MFDATGPGINQQLLGQVFWPRPPRMSTRDFSLPPPAGVAAAAVAAAGPGGRGH